MGYFIRYNLSSLAILAYFLTDRMTKNYFLVNPTKILDWGFIKLHLVKNDAGIFGLPLPGGINTQIIVLLILFSSIIYLFKREKKKVMLIYGVIMMFTGGLSNILDRFYHGFVIDFIDLGFWPVFNLSDALISFGTIVVLWRVFK
ncbi:MAG: Lipoprotein signal peptidase [candidate division WS2 bacterium]|nr:Lipoprotein signal peptidase [Candidatus Lithacetigena glycinireducens]MBT9174613.1 Lipoprotein signal peptidase [Candidatus Lithacetigena glycinireducens]